MILSVTGCELFEKIPPGGIISLQAENTIQSEVVKMIIKINMHNIEKAEFLAAAKTIREVTNKVEKQLEE